MPVTIPCDPTLTRYSMQVVLDGATFGFLFFWNIREEAWYMDVTREDGTPILLGKKVVINAPLGGRSVDPHRYPGILMAIDTTGQNLDAGIADLGDRVQLVYMPGDEVLAGP